MLFVNIRSHGAKCVMKAELIETIIMSGKFSALKVADTAIVGVLQRALNKKVVPIIDLNIALGQPFCADTLGTRILLTKIMQDGKSVTIGIRAEGVTSLTKNLIGTSETDSGNFLSDEEGEVYRSIEPSTLLKSETIKFLIEEFGDD